MPARRLPVDPADVDPEAIAVGADALLAGELVAFPTETVYGLGAVATDEDAVGRIFSAKGRPSSDPLIVHVLPDADLGEVAAGERSTVECRLVEALWPGPLTLVVPRGPGIGPTVTAGGPSVAVRSPAHPVALALLAATGRPIAAPSANRFSYVSPTSADHVARDLGDACAVILDGGRTTWGIESTVVAERDGALVVLRHGAVTAEELAAAVGDLVAVVDPAADVDEGASASPGRMVRHYAPSTATVAVAPGVVTGETAAALAPRSTYLGRGPRPAHLPARVRYESLAAPDDLVGAAWSLYDALRRIDAEGTTDLLLVELTGAGGLGRAIDDRIGRAASGRRARTAGELGALLAD
ncbi:MAG: L-threonylcarbamoyladenylate synthase [Acidimicrobiales bacterium]